LAALHKIISKQYIWKQLHITTHCADNIQFYSPYVDNTNSYSTFFQMMRQMGGLGGGGDSKPSFGDLEPESDSDDEELPDLE
jgi:hypothetical protein